MSYSYSGYDNFDLAVCSSDSCYEAQLRYGAYMYSMSYAGFAEFIGSTYCDGIPSNADVGTTCSNDGSGGSDDDEVLLIAAPTVAGVVLIGGAVAAIATLRAHSAKTATTSMGTAEMVPTEEGS